MYILTQGVEGPCTCIFNPRSGGALYKYILTLGVEGPLYMYIITLGVEGPCTCI